MKPPAVHIPLEDLSPEPVRPGDLVAWVGRSAAAGLGSLSTARGIGLCISVVHRKGYDNAHLVRVIWLAPAWRSIGSRVSSHLTESVRKIRC